MESPEYQLNTIQDIYDLEFIEQSSSKNMLDCDQIYQQKKNKQLYVLDRKEESEQESIENVPITYQPQIIEQDVKKKRRRRNNTVKSKNPAQTKKDESQTTNKQEGKQNQKVKKKQIQQPKKNNKKIENKQEKKQEIKIKIKKIEEKKDSEKQQQVQIIKKQIAKKQVCSSSTGKVLTRNQQQQIDKEEEEQKIDKDLERENKKLSIDQGRLCDDEVDHIKQLFTKNRRAYVMIKWKNRKRRDSEYWIELVKKYEGQKYQKFKQDHKL